MRAFVFACIAAAVVAVVGAAVLSVFEKPAQVAFSTDAVRL
jgi:integral membrane sensor domain MASE1